MATLSEQLAEFVVTVHYGALPDAVRAMAQKTVLDWAGAVLAGATQPPAAMARRALLPPGGRPEAEVVGTGACTDALRAALLAREGFTGARAILEGEQGFFQAMAAGADSDRVTDGLGERFAITENSFKLFPCCGHTHSAIAAALEVRSRGGVDLPAIDEVQVETYGAALQVTGNRDPRTPYQAKFSLPYAVTAALRWGRVGLGEFEPAALTDPEVRGLLGRVRVTVDPALDRRYPAAWPARLTVRLKGGPTHTVLVEQAPGEHGAAVPYEALAAKFRDLLEWTVGQAGAQPTEGPGGTLAGDTLRERYAAVPEAVRQLAGVERLGPGALWGAGQGEGGSPGQGAGVRSPTRR